MKKRNIIIFTIISIFATFIFSEIFNIYHFGDIPTLLTCFYLISIFSIIEFVLFCLVYITKMRKIKLKTLLGMVLIFLGLLLVLMYEIILNIDWLNWYAYSSPFYLNVIVRSLELLIPALLLIIFGINIIKKTK